jgi:hypothetical protein
VDLRECDRDLTDLSKRLQRAELHGNFELAAVLAEEIDRLLDHRVLLQAALDSCPR